jgi:hypothetical protein
VEGFEGVEGGAGFDLDFFFRVEVFVGFVVLVGEVGEFVEEEEAFGIRRGFDEGLDFFQGPAFEGEGFEDLGFLEAVGVLRQALEVVEDVLGLDSLFDVDLIGGPGEGEHAPGVVFEGGDGVEHFLLWIGFFWVSTKRKGNSLPGGRELWI